MFHISEKLTAEPVYRDNAIKRLANVLMTCLKAACQEIPPLPDIDDGISIRQEIYKLSMQIKQGLPSELRVSTDDDRLEFLHDILEAIPTEFLVPKTMMDDSGAGSIPDLSVFPDLDEATTLPESSVHAINMVVEKTIHLIPQTLSEHRVMRTKLHILALLMGCLLIHRVQGYSDVFTPDYKRAMRGHYQTMKRMYLW